MMEALHSRALLGKHEMSAICSTGLPQHAWASVHPDAAIEHLRDIHLSESDRGTPGMAACDGSEICGTLAAIGFKGGVAKR